MPNRLALEKSPYLLQHANNPVDWYPWGEEAFARARNEDKPIFLSIGYSTCHWCHVMERESFESPETAALMNNLYVCIKVDREERPDIDRIYMAYVQATTGSGGWPMSVWLTPDLKPFVGGTYFPPDNRYGRAGFPLVLERVAEAWVKDRERILQSSDEVMERLRESDDDGSGDGHAHDGPGEAAFLQLHRAFDSRLGGFGSAPKFPRPASLHFLLRYWKRTGNADALDMVATTLIAMEKGGMHDQLGGGFHRYSVDEYWFVPHFEKMLYDQAQLAAAYLECYQITGNDAMESAARRTLDYVMRDMTAPEGAFWSAEDADSVVDPADPHHKSEGYFYIWEWDEVAKLVGPEAAAWFGYRYGMERTGNVRNDPHGEFTGRNILFQARTIAVTAEHFDADPREIAASIALTEKLLMDARGGRVRPHLDDKILTAWNGLMISAFAKAARILGEPKYAAAAARAADFILSTLVSHDGAVLRRYRDGDAAIGGMLDDYAFLVQALLDLYETTFEFRYLARALTVSAKQSQLLEDSEGGGFYASAHPDAVSLMRHKDDYDGAEPSGNSVALLNLLRLSRMTDRPEFEVSARKLVAAFDAKLRTSPYGMPQMLCSWEYDLAAPREIVVAGQAEPWTTATLWSKFDPNRVVLHATPALVELRPVETRAAMSAMSGPAVYICENFACNAPARDSVALAALLE